jgi:hypothetical protein
MSPGWRPAISLATTNFSCGKYAENLTYLRYAADEMTTPGAFGNHPATPNALNAFGRRFVVPQMPPATSSHFGTSSLGGGLLLSKGIANCERSNATMNSNLPVHGPWSISQPAHHGVQPLSRDLYARLTLDEESDPGIASVLTEGPDSSVYKSVFWPAVEPLK